MNIKSIEETFAAVSKELGWSVDKRIALAVTNLYLSQEKLFDKGRHKAASDVIKKKEGWASPFKAHLHHIAAAFIAIKEEDPEETLKLVNQYQQQLNEAGFRKNPYTYLAALLMDAEEDIDKARRLYEEMKSRHKFLTSHEDVPYAVLLGRQPGEPEERAETMNVYYKELREQGFSMGNDLQWLSQVMTFNSPEYDPEMIGRVLAIREFFLTEKIKVRPAQYPVLGFLAVTGADGAALKAISDGTRELESTKLFRWYKDVAFSTAVQMVMKEVAETRDLSAMTFSVSLETLMQGPAGGNDGQCECRCHRFFNQRFPVKLSEKTVFFRLLVTLPAEGYSIPVKKNIYRCKDKGS